MIKALSDNSGTAFSDITEKEVAEMLRDFLLSPHLVYRDAYEDAREQGITRPGRELGDLLGVAESTANKYARERESDEAPQGTGARSDWERLVLTFKHFLIPHSIGVAQTCVHALQQLIDDAVERRAALVKDPAELKESVLRQSSEVLVAIGADKPSADVLSAVSEAQIATKIYSRALRNREGSDDKLRGVG